MWCLDPKGRSSDSKSKKKKREEDAVQTHSSLVTTTSAKYCPVTSGRELYRILQTKNSGILKDEGKLSEIEKVAKAIVEINVYLATQVIYPAIQKYCQESQRDAVEGKMGIMQRNDKTVSS